MSIKTYLRTLLESVFTSKKEWVRRQAMPKVPVSVISYDVPTSQNTHSLTASEDGWLSIYTYGGVLDVYASTGISIGHSSMDYCGMMLPVIKGQTITMICANNTKMFVRLYKAIGTA